MKIFGIRIDDLSHRDTIRRVREFLGQPQFHRIATVNPEFLLEADKNPAFKEVLRAADLRIVDGVGIVLVGLLRGRWIRRFPGADLMEEILRIADRERLSVYLAVRSDGLSTFDEIRSAMSKKYPALEISGADIDPKHMKEYTPQAANCKLVLCNFGAPEQELFLESLRSAPGGIRLAMGVGGAFDYLTGKQRRAPKWLRIIGLEWLWRLVQQPKRWRRIWNAAIVFPFRAIFATMKK